MRANQALPGGDHVMAAPSLVRAGASIWPVASQRVSSITRSWPARAATPSRYGGGYAYVTDEEDRVTLLRA